LGSDPVLCWCFPAFWFAFSVGETQVWLGDLRVVAFGVVVVSLFCFNRFADFKDLVSLYRCFCCLLSCKDRAISATSAKLEEKKNLVAGYYTPKRSHLKIVVLPQRLLPILLAGAIFALCVTEGERVVPPIGHYGRFLCTNLHLFVKHLPRAQL